MYPSGLLNVWIIITANIFSAYYAPGGSDSKESACNAGDLGSIPGLGRTPGEGHGNSLQYSCLENPVDGGKPGGLPSMGLQRVRHDWATKHSTAQVLSSSLVYREDITYTALLFAFFSQQWTMNNGFSCQKIKIMHYHFNRHILYHCLNVS